MDSDLLQGRINGDKLRELAAHLLDFSRFEHAFICGPAAMMDEAEIALRELGVPEDAIHLERFNTPDSRAAGYRRTGRGPRGHDSSGRPRPNHCPERGG